MHAYHFPLTVFLPPPSVSLLTTVPLPLGAILPATVVAASSSALPTVTQSQAAALSQLGVQQAAGAPPGMPPGGAGPPAGGAPFPPINFSQPPPNFNQPPPGFPPGAVPPMEMLPRGEYIPQVGGVAWSAKGLRQHLIILCSLLLKWDDSRLCEVE